MKIKMLYLTGLILISLSVTWQPAQAEVTYREPNPHNTIIFVNDEPWEPEGFIQGTTIPAAYVASPGIDIDGRDDESAWEGALDVDVSLSYGKVGSAKVKALYTDKEVFIRVRWADATEDRQHHPWVWNADTQSYVPGPQVEDSVMLSFEAGCEWTPSLLGGYMYDFDAWHWLAARSDPLGQAVDLYGNVQDRPMRNPDFHRFDSRVVEDDWVMKITENHDMELTAAWDELDRVYMKQEVTKVLYVRAVPDGGPNYPDFVRQLAAPAGVPRDESLVYPQFMPLKLEGGAGEVAASGRWEDGHWTVEFRRDRLTPARAVFDTLFNRLVQFSLQVFDSTEALDEASESGRLFLRFLPDEFSQQRLLANE
jgi:hypothetical protein